MNKFYLRNVIYQVRVSEIEKRKIQKMAKQSGVNLSVFVRARTLSPPSNDEPPKVPSQGSKQTPSERIAFDLARMGNKINHITKALNGHVITSETPDLDETLIEINNYLRSLRTKASN